MNENKKTKINKAYAIAFWILTAICMGIIFYFSSRTADESSTQSNAVIDFLYQLFGKTKLSDFIVRKSAHFLEFTGLCVLFNSAFYFTKGKKWIIQSIACTSVYAITDEIHQIFVDGRSCQFTDWCIDTAGAIAGAIAFLIIYYIINLILTSVRRSHKIS